ncbi:PspC domain-containing protein [Parabacteroides sp. 52]|uniref:PspC domain-containing protein n=1 Tax=unclassified Parabacteroides TaxID=2649774 RepID=UPI0013D81F23|nr:MULTISPECIES: PspC domain-containing protein [unclassified Parabacteroides]MDH6534394.1 phage shock protein PspC (stress-responsive transcriptional regulator) [Parabacteroides sp. PM5-20]NDV54893.1 PspC domain-containing protein [Parabacteroides sp. 52]
MKKTLTVNLGGTVFHIDEDAYQLLDKYLSNLRIHFRKEEGSDEIMNDFEIRISELLHERIKLGYEVISLEQVEEVIKRMGKPEEIFGDSFQEEEKEEYQEKTETVYTKRRLFRNPDDRILGGVAGGLAAYLGWDPTAIRLGLILLMIFWGVIIPVYFVLWLIIPMAHTATEKLQMRGEKVTVENIGKTVTDGFERVSNNVNDYISSGKPRSTLQKLGDAFVSIFGVLVKVVGILFAVVLLPPVLLILFVLLVVLFAVVVGLLGGGIGLLGGGMGILEELSPWGGGWGLVPHFSEGALIGSTIGTILVIGIPVVSLLYLIGGQLFKWKPMPSQGKWILLVIWVIALAATIVIATHYGLPAWNIMNGWHWGMMPI